MEKATHRTKKIAIVGPESSGKTTLANQLASHFSACWVKEYARTYLEKNGGKYTIYDLTHFAEGQIISEEKFNDCDFLFCDTNPLSVKVWSSYKYGKCSKEIDSVIQKSHYDLHLLLKPDLPYEDDPLREDSPLKNRIELFELFEKELIKLNINYSIVSGQNNLRLKNAIKVIQNHFSI